MKQLILVFGVLLALTGCGPSAEHKEFPILPDVLKDCKFYRLTDGNGASITVARCPNSTTTTRQSDKAGTTSVIIDGKEYVSKE
jgi:hypothetical protein